MLSAMAAHISPRWSPLPSGLGILLRNARVDAGLSRTALAARLHVSTGTVQGLEEQQRPPSRAVAAGLAEALHLDPWRAAVLHSVAVDIGQLRTRRGVRHINRRQTALPHAVHE